MILSACSPFFKKLLSNNPHSHPLIYVKGVSSSSLTAVTNFLYLGESSILHEELYSFLALAKEFQLRGLDGSYEEKKLESRHRFIATKSSTEFNQAKHIPQRKISNLKLDIETKSFEGTLMTYHQKSKINPSIEQDTVSNIESLIEKHTEGYSCKSCDYTSKKVGHMKEHVERHIDGLEYPCHLCNKIFRSSNSFRGHKRHYL